MSWVSRSFLTRKRRGRSALTPRLLLKTGLLLALIVSCGWFYLHHKVHSELRHHVQTSIDEKLADSNLDVQIGSAQFIEQQGLRLNKVSFGFKANADRPQPHTAGVEIDEVFLHAPVSITQLVSCEIKPVAVEVRRAKLEIRRLKNGLWNWEELYRSILALKSTDCGPVPVSFTDCDIQWIDPANHQQPITLSDVSLEILPIQHQGRPLLQISGQFGGRDLKNLQFDAYLDQQQKKWTAEFQSRTIRLSKDLFALLPASVLRDLHPLPDFSATLAVQGTVNGNMPMDDHLQFNLIGNVREFSSTDSRLPQPISNASVDFEISDQQIKLTDVQGKFGSGPFHFDYWQHGLLSRDRWSTAGYVKQLDFTQHQKLAQWLPAYFGKFFQDFSPTGPADIQFRLEHDGEKLIRDIHGRLTGMSFAFAKLPYRIERCVGDVRLVNNNCRFDVRALEGNQVIEIKGFSLNPGPAATYQINLAVPGSLPIDSKMLNALKAIPKFASIVNRFSPSGQVGGIGRIEKQLADGPVSRSFDVQLKQCNVQHDHFKYPIQNVNGLVRTRNHKYTFVDITGSNGGSQITCNGDWNPTTGLSLRFLCNSVALDEQLRFALNPTLREIWDGFRPRGTVNLMRVDMKLPLGQQSCDVTVEASMPRSDPQTANRFVSINPVWFPYEIQHLAGTVKVGDGEIKLTNFAGQHNGSWLSCQGQGNYDQQSWAVKLQNMLVGSLKVDDELLAAIPKSLAGPVSQLKYEGLLNVHGEVTLAGQHQEPETQTQQKSPHHQHPTGTQLGWDVRFDMNRANMKMGLPLKNVFGTVHLVGKYDGQRTTCRGELDIDSLTIYDAQITKIKGPIWLDNEKAAGGIYATPTNSTIKIEPNAFTPPPTSAEPPSSIRGVMHGGVIKFDANMSSGPTGEFYLQTTIADGNLKNFCREFAPQLSQISGRSFAALQLAGNSIDTQSYRGQGTIQLRDAKIYELPVILSLLKILHVKQVNRTAFDSSNVDFTVSGETINLNRIELVGDAISLIGNGTTNLDRDIDMNFYSVAGRNRINIPLISDLYRASSQQILWITVDGTLDNPQPHRSVLPHINDSLKQLFQPVDRAQENRRWHHQPRQARGLLQSPRHRTNPVIQR